jgi:hypothetical protein
MSVYILRWPSFIHRAIANFSTLFSLEILGFEHQRMANRFLLLVRSIVSSLVYTLFITWWETKLETRFNSLSFRSFQRLVLGIRLVGLTQRTRRFRYIGVRNSSGSELFIQPARLRMYIMTCNLG